MDFKKPRPCISATLTERSCSFLLCHGQLLDNLNELRDTIVAEDGENFLRIENVDIRDILWLREKHRSPVVRNKILIGKRFVLSAHE